MDSTDNAERCAERYPHDPHDPHDVSSDHNPAQVAFRCPGVVWEHRQYVHPGGQPVDITAAPRSDLDEPAYCGDFKPHDAHRVTGIRNSLEYGTWCYGVGGSADRDEAKTAPDGSITVRDLARETGVSVSHVIRMSRVIQYHSRGGSRVFEVRGDWPGDSVLTAGAADAIREWDAPAVDPSAVPVGAVQDSDRPEDTTTLLEVAQEIVKADQARERAGFTMLGMEHVVNDRVWSWACRTAGAQS